jgi:hypothetical protein
VPLLETEIRLGRDQQRRGRPSLCPLVAAGVEVVVDPGDGAVPRVRLQGRQLPVRAAAPRHGVEADVGKLGKAQQLGEVEVRLVLPAARPDQLEALREAQQAGAGDQRDAVGDPVDELEVGMGRPLLEAEEADDAIDIDGQQRPVRSYQR